MTQKSIFFPKIANFAKSDFLITITRPFGQKKPRKDLHLCFNVRTVILFLRHIFSFQEQDISCPIRLSFTPTIFFATMRKMTASHLHHFPLRTLGEDEDLVVQRIQRLPHWLGLLLGHTGAILQEVNFDVRRWNNRTNNREIIWAKSSAFRTEFQRR